MRTLKLAIVSLLLLPTTAAAAVGTLSATFTGKSSQNQPVVIHVVQGVVAPPSRISWSVRCGATTLSGAARLAGRLDGKGGFAPPPVHGVTNAAGIKFMETTAVRLTVSSRMVRGAFVSTVTAYPASGGQIQRCQQTVTFTARR